LLGTEFTGHAIREATAAMLSTLEPGEPTHGNCLCSPLILVTLRRPNSPTIPTAKRIAEALETKLAELFKGL
jgi:hypothetical protein